MVGTDQRGRFESTEIRSQLLSVGAGLRYGVDTPESGPEGMGFWLKATLLFPR